MFFIYMTYTLLALHLQECVVSGLLLAVTQLVTIRRNFTTCNIQNFRPVVAQLVERLLQIPEVRGSNPVVGKFYILSAVLKRP